MVARISGITSPCPLPARSETLRPVSPISDTPSLPFNVYTDLHSQGDLLRKSHKTWVILHRSAAPRRQWPASACDPLPSIVRTTPPASPILRESNHEATPIAAGQMTG